MEKLKAIWTALDGNKSAIGGYLLVAAYALGKLAGIWGLQYPWLPPAIETLSEAGAALTGVGLIHKGVKAVTP